MCTGSHNDAATVLSVAVDLPCQLFDGVLCCGAGHGICGWGHSDVPARGACLPSAVPASGWVRSACKLVFRKRWVIPNLKKMQLQHRGTPYKRVFGNYVKYVAGFPSFCCSDFVYLAAE